VDILHDAKCEETEELGTGNFEPETNPKLETLNSELENADP
jgi:hypothetical protein